MPKEMMSTSRQMVPLGQTVANGIDRARFDLRGVIIGGGIAGILAGIGDALRNHEVRRARAECELVQM